MTIALGRAKPRSGYHYELTGTLSRNADWVQTLELPADDSTISVTAQTVRITFRYLGDDTSAVMTVSTTASQINITDADTISINVTNAVMSGLIAGDYVTDLASETAGGVITHWAHGLVTVPESPVAF